MPDGLCWCSDVRTNAAIAAASASAVGIRLDAQRDPVGPVAGRVVDLAAGAQRRGAGADHLRRAAVVGGQGDDRDAGIDPLDLGHRRVVGTVPSIDRLARIADQTDVGTPTSPRLEQRVLQRVEVLRLVDEEVTEPPMNQAAERRIGFDGAQVEVQQVVEVDHPAPPLQPLVRRGEVDEASGRHSAAPPCCS